MSDLKQQLIRLGHQNPELRKHLTPILDQITRKFSMDKESVLQQYVGELLRHLPTPDSVKDDSMMTKKSLVWRGDGMAPDMVVAEISVLAYQQGPVVRVEIQEGAMRGSPEYDSNDEYLPGMIHQRDGDGVAKPPVRDMIGKIQEHIDRVLG